MLKGIAKSPVIITGVLTLIMIGITAMVISSGYEDTRGATMGHFKLNKEIPNAKDRELILAAARGEVNKMDRLIAEGANVNAVGPNGVTPLFWVTGQPEINYRGLEALLRHGANPNYVPPFGSGLYGDSMTYLLGSGDDIEALKLVLKYGGNPNIIDPEDNASGNHQTVLIAAAQNGFIDNMKLLLKYGANIEGIDATGMTPLLWAIFNRQYETAYYLLEQGANYKTVAIYPGTYLGSEYHITDKDKATISDLIGTDLGVSLREGVSNAEEPWREKVIKWLEARGVPRPKPAPY